MNRSPLALSKYPPSPRAVSVIRTPEGIRPVGWNWVNSMSSRGNPARYDMAIPSPVEWCEKVVNSYMRSQPPVAIIIALAWNTYSSPVFKSMAVKPTATLSSTMRDVTNHSLYTFTFRQISTLPNSVCISWKPVRSAAKTTLGKLAPPLSRWLIFPLESLLQGSPQCSNVIISFGPCLTKNSTASWSARKSAPLIVSQEWRSYESPSLNTTLVPPCAQTECERTGYTSEIIATSHLSLISVALTAALSPVKPPPIMTRSWEIFSTSHPQI